MRDAFHCIVVGTRPRPANTTRLPMNLPRSRYTYSNIVRSIGGLWTRMEFSRSAYRTTIKRSRTPVWNVAETDGCWNLVSLRLSSSMNINIIKVK